MKIPTAVNALIVSNRQQAEMLYALAKSLPVVPIELVDRAECLNAIANKLEKEVEGLQGKLQKPEVPMSRYGSPIFLGQ